MSRLGQNLVFLPRDDSFLFWIRNQHRHIPVPLIWMEIVLCNWTLDRMKDGLVEGADMSALFIRFHWAGIVSHIVYLGNYTV